MGFIRGRSTIDVILALRLLSAIHCEFNRPVNVVYLDIKAAFDSVDRRALWKALRSRGIPDVLTDLIAAIHENTGAAIHVPNGPTNSAVTATMFPLRLCGGKPLVAVTRERRYGLSQLHVNDDDDGWIL